MKNNNVVPSVLLVNFLIDARGDMYKYQGLMEDCLTDFQMKLYASEECNRILISRTLFNNDIVREGYVRPFHMDTSYSAQGGSKIYDAIYGTYAYTSKYAKRLRNAGKYVQPLIIILSCGYDTGSNCMSVDARYAVKKLMLERIKVKFIAFGKQASTIPGLIGISKRDVLMCNKGKLQLKWAVAEAFKHIVAEAQKMGPSYVAGKNFIMLK